MIKFFFLFLVFSTDSFGNIDLKKIGANSHSCSLNKENVFFFYWATWCVTCKDKLQSKLPKLMNKQSNAQIISVNIDKDKKRVEHYLKKYKIKDIAVCYEPKRTIEIEHKVNIAPFSVFLKSHKVLRARKGFDLKEVRNFITKGKL